MIKYHIFFLLSVSFKYGDHIVLFSSDMSSFGGLSGGVFLNPSNVQGFESGVYLFLNGGGVEAEIRTI